MSLTADAKFFEDLSQIILEERDTEELESLIRRSLLVKKDIIEKDEFDTDYRRISTMGIPSGMPWKPIPTTKYLTERR